MRRMIISLLTLIVVIMVLSGCQRTEGDAEVSGQILYLQRIALPEDAVVTVRIVNASLADASLEKTLLAEEIIDGPGQVPISYSVRYNSDDVEDNLMYSMIARIEDGDGNLLFINQSIVPVITLDNPTSDVEILVQPVGSAASTSMHLPPADEPTPVPTWPPAIITAAYATVQAYAAAPAPRQGAAPVNTSEMENATAVPASAPVIVNFFASDVPESSDVRFNLNWDTQNANRVEIAGFVMDNPYSGSWPVYAGDNDWVLWAANDVAWVDSFLEVRPDADIGSSLSNISVSRYQVTMSVRDPQFVDGDNLTVVVNGYPILVNYTLDGRFVSFPISLFSGPNQIHFQIEDEGTSPLAVFELQVSSVTSGPSTQFSRALRAGEGEPITITAP